MVETATTGGRALRKEQTRQRIAENAMRLFARDGFDAVTVAEVARAAGVTEKTVFNHFETKEDLVYSEDTAFRTALLESVRARSARASVLDAAERFFLDRYRRLEFDPAVRRRASVFATLVVASPALQAREHLIHARYAEALSELIATEQGATPDDIRPRLTAEALLAVHRESIAAIRRAILTEVPDAELAAHAVTTASRGFDLLARGLRRYAAKRG
ncbi:TetR/AcrR family transcriptional regulator [Nonomuraea sp. ZG12]|uniref:TetR/AcrR family transcriptional regulator n=1 Tax=Nonomuraea sp. ZG12 TaxID=3452207 RepID=UPI003F8952BD